ncbi:MAG TPA: AMP-binding protein [Beutenbergiaceae bacterium]|nr:AMP-binding protein [Beutenbergiaceae bacterium]
MTPTLTATELLPRLRTALAGGPPVRLDQVAGTAPAPAPSGTAVVVRTSGSTTGVGRAVALSAEALRHSAGATHERLSGPGQWLLAVPPVHIAGIQVLVRSTLAGYEPVVLPDGRFEPAALAETIRSMRSDVPRYLSLVPTQLHRVLDAGSAVTSAVATCAAVLIGGAHLPAGLRTRAERAGITVVHTYGMTETSGGCVYDGVPLEGVRVQLAEGRILLTGPVLATGYLSEPHTDGDSVPSRRPTDPFMMADGERWFRTSDAGRWVDGRLQVLGRVDDVIITGGVNVHPVLVEHALAEMPGVAEAVVVGLPDPQWGQLLTVVLRPSGTPGTNGPNLTQVRAHVRDRLGQGAHVPRALVAVTEFPLRGPGKIDRITVTAQAAAALASGAGQRHRD